MKRGRLAAWVAFASVGACSTEATAPPAQAVPTSLAATVNPKEATSAPEVPAPTTDALALLGPSLAPGMREVARGESALPLSIVVPGESSDVCLRAVVAAGAPVAAALIAEGRTLALSEPGPRALLDAHGPICLRKGTHARIEAQGPRGPARYVVWASP